MGLVSDCRPGDIPRPSRTPRRTWQFWLCAIVILPALLAVAGADLASAAQPAPPPPPESPQKVDGATISTLIRGTIIALHDANVTGNYTVLRDLGANELQVANTAADLAARFADFRQKRINLAPAVIFDPVLDQKPQLSTNGTLRLVGHFPTSPQQVIFDLTFRFEAGAWRIAQISVGIRPAPAPAAANPAPPAADAPKASPQVRPQKP